MSKHSKWSTIKRQKGITDQKRGQLFTKLGRAITIAIRQGGGITDPEENFKLRLAIEKAKKANMPKENIERAIKRAKGKLAEMAIEEVLYEGYGPFGIAVIVEAATDNKKRTSQILKSIFERAKGNLASTGSVSYLFERKGLILVAKDKLTEEAVLEKAIEAGAEDLEKVEDGFEIYTKTQNLHQVKEKLEGSGLKIIDSELTFRPKSLVTISEKEEAQKILKFMDSLEEIEDVQRVYANFDIPREVLKQI